MSRVERSLREQARTNRGEMNHAETRLWWHLRRRQFDVRFRRQHPLYGRIMDFACLSLKVNIEVDGSQHDHDLDRIRDDYLRSRGWTVLRFRSWEIYRDNEVVLATIGATIDDLKRRRLDL